MALGIVHQGEWLDSKQASQRIVSLVWPHLTVSGFFISGSDE